MSKHSQVVKAERNREIIKFWLHEAENAPGEGNREEKTAAKFGISVVQLYRIINSSVGEDTFNQLFDLKKELFAQNYAVLMLLREAALPLALQLNFDAFDRVLKTVAEQNRMLTAGIDKIIPIGDGKEQQLQEKLIASGSEESQWIIDLILADDDFEGRVRPEDDTREKLREYEQKLSVGQKDNQEWEGSASDD